VTGWTAVDLPEIDDFLAKISIVAGILVKQPPVHANVPDERVAGARKCRHNPDVQESTARTAYCITGLHCSDMQTHTIISIVTAVIFINVVLQLHKKAELQKSS